LLAQVDMLLHTASPTFWNPKCDVFRSSVDIFLKVVDGMWVRIGCRLLQMMLEEKKSLGLRSGDPSGHFVIPMRPIHLASLAPRQRDEMALHRDEIKSASYCEWVDIHVRLQQTIQQLEVLSGAHCPCSKQYWSLDSVAIFSAPHCCSGVSLLVSVSPVTWGMRWTQYPVLGPFAYPFK